MRLILSLVTLITACQVLAYPNGAPESACQDMLPHHPTKSAMDADGHALPQEGENPYTITVNTKMYSAKDHEVIVTVTGPVFEGFLLMATKESDGSPFGHFDLAPDSQYLKCGGENEATVTHTAAFHDDDHTSEEEAEHHPGDDSTQMDEDNAMENSTMAEDPSGNHPNGSEADQHHEEGQSSESELHSDAVLDGPTKTITFHWRGVEETPEDVKFHVTVVQHTSIFWVKFSTETVKYSSAGLPMMSSFLLLTALISILLS